MNRKSEAFFSVSLPEHEVAPTTRAMGREPSRMAIQRVIDSTVPYETTEFHSWQLLSPLPESAPVNKHIDALLEILRPKAEIVRSLASRFQGSIHCVVSYYDDYATPGIELWQPTVHSLAELSLAATFDLYFFGERGRPG